MKAIILASLLSASLVACGGGGSPTVDNSAAIQQAFDHIKVPGVSNPAPPVSTVFTSAMVNLNNINLGLVLGTSDIDVATKAANTVVIWPTLYADDYKLLLSGAGLPVKVFGNLTGKKNPDGSDERFSDSYFVAKLTTGGLVVVRV